MRVAVHFPDGSVAAYKLGRIVDGTHTDDLLSGKVTPVSDIADALADQAEAEYPDAKVVIEQWKDNGDGTSEWVAVEDAVNLPEPASSKVVEAAPFDITQETSSFGSLSPSTDDQAV